MEDRLLMALEYLRKYRTYFHIAQGYEINERACYRNICWIEDILVRHQNFKLPGKKELKKLDRKYEVLVIDVTETPTERPKKSKNDFIQDKNLCSIKF